ncbi:unnamed protein product, partial [marine sediment metagenome]
GHIVLAYPFYQYSRDKRFLSNLYKPINTKDAIILGKVIGILR